MSLKNSCDGPLSREGAHSSRSARQREGAHALYCARQTSLSHRFPPEREALEKGHVKLKHMTLRGAHIEDMHTLTYHLKWQCDARISFTALSSFLKNIECENVAFLDVWIHDGKRHICVHALKPNKCAFYNALLTHLKISPYDFSGLNIDCFLSQP